MLMSEQMQCLNPLNRSRHVYGHVGTLGRSYIELFFLVELIQAPASYRTDALSLSIMKCLTGKSPELTFENVPFSTVAVVDGTSGSRSKCFL